MNRMAFSHDDAWLAFGGQDGDLALWKHSEATGWRELRRDDLGEGNVLSLSWHPASPHLLIALEDGRFLVRDPAGEDHELLRAAQASSNLAAFSPEGGRIVMAHGKVVGIVPLGGGKEVQLELPETVTAVAWTDGALLIGLIFGRTMIWRPGMKSAELLFSGSGSATGGMVTAISPHASLAAIGSADGTLSFLGWELGINAVAPIRTGLPVTDVVWGPGTLVASASTGDTVRIDEPGRGTADEPALGSVQTNIWAVAPHPSGEPVAVGGGEGQLFVGPIDGKATPARCATAGDAIISPVAWSPDGTRLAAPGGDGGVRVWRAGAGGCELIAATPGSDDFVYDVGWSPDGQELLVVHRGAGPSRWRVADPAKPIWRTEGELARVMRVAWEPGGKRLAGAVTRGSDQVFLWTLGEEAAARRVAMPPALHANDSVQLAWRPGAAQVAVTTRATALFDVETGAFKWISPAIPGAMAAVWSPDGRDLLVVDRGGVIRVLDGETGELAAETASSMPSAFSAAWTSRGILVGGAGFVNATLTRFPSLDEILAELRSFVAWGGDAAAVVAVGQGLTRTLWQKRGDP